MVPSAAVDCVRGDPSSQLDPELELVGYPVGYLVDVKSPAGDGGSIKIWKPLLSKHGGVGNAEAARLGCLWGLVALPSPPPSLPSRQTDSHGGRMCCSIVSFGAAAVVAASVLSLMMVSDG